MNRICHYRLDDLRHLPAATRFQITAASIRPQYRCPMRLPAVVDVSADEGRPDDFPLESEIRTAPIRQCGFNQLRRWKPICATRSVQATFAHLSEKVWDIAFQQVINLAVDDRRIARRHGDVRGHFL